MEGDATDICEKGPEMDTGTHCLTVQCTCSQPLVYVSLFLCVCFLFYMSMPKYARVKVTIYVSVSVYAVVCLAVYLLSLRMFCVYVYRVSEIKADIGIYGLIF